MRELYFRMAECFGVVLDAGGNGLRNLAHLPVEMEMER